MTRYKETKAVTKDEEEKILKEVENIAILKRSLSELSKFELNAEKEKNAVLNLLHSQEDNVSTERKRQMIKLKIKLQKRKIEENQFEDAATWIKSTDEKSLAKKQAQKEKQAKAAKQRLENLRSKRNSQTEELQEPTDYADKIAFKIDQMQKIEMQFIVDIIDTNAYLKHGKNKAKLLEDLSKCENLTQAVSIRLAIISLESDQPDIELVAQVTQAQNIISDKILKSESRENIFEDVEKQRMESVKIVAYGTGTSEEE